MKKVLIVKGGWDGHDPDLISDRIARIMREEGYDAEVSADLNILCDEKYLKECSLIIVNCTMGELPGGASMAVSEAVASGVGLAGCHGGLCDAFRTDTHWQFMTGGQWVSHPGNDGVKYTVKIVSDSPIVEGIGDFEVVSEHYYLHVDPAVKVLAATRFPVVEGPHSANGEVDMPVAFTKRWGMGKVFYCSLGHNDKVFESSRSAELLITRGLLWAARD